MWIKRRNGSVMFADFSTSRYINTVNFTGVSTGGSEGGVLRLEPVMNFDLYFLESYGR
jgi:hypothetical protein